MEQELKGKVAFVTGGSGLLGGHIGESLAMAGAKTVFTYHSGSAATKRVENINQSGGQSMAVMVDVLDEESVEHAAGQVIDRWGKIDVLVNAAGGHVKGSSGTPDPEVATFDIPTEQIRQVMDLNLYGTIIPSMSIARHMSKRKSGSIINISSMASTQAITHALGYSMAKAGIDIFTKWMAMELAQKFGDGLRVNAIAPGFFISDQNRDRLVDAQGNLTDRAQKIIAKTPMARFGEPSELNGVIRLLASDSARFITGTVIPVDGGFSSFSGV